MARALVTVGFDVILRASRAFAAFPRGANAVGNYALVTGVSHRRCVELAVLLVLPVYWLCFPSASIEKNPHSMLWRGSKVITYVVEHY